MSSCGFSMQPRFAPLLVGRWPGRGQYVALNASPAGVVLGTVLVAGQAARAGPELLAHAGGHALVAAGALATEMSRAGVGAAGRRLVATAACGGRVRVPGMAARAVGGGCRECQPGSSVAAPAISFQVQRVVERQHALGPHEISHPYVQRAGHLGSHGGHLGTGVAAQALPA